MHKAIWVILLFLLTGCATTPTKAGREIKVRRAAEVSECKKLGSVTGNAGSILTNGDYGIYYATSDARNKAAGIPGADTLVIAERESMVFGGEVSGIVYACGTRSVESVQSPSAAPMDYNLGKSRKCRARGGVWRDNQCVILID